MNKDIVIIATILKVQPSDLCFIFLVLNPVIVQNIAIDR